MTSRWSTSAGLLGSGSPNVEPGGNSGCDAVGGCGRLGSVTPTVMGSIDDAGCGCGGMMVLALFVAARLLVLTRMLPA